MGKRPDTLSKYTNLLKQRDDVLTKQMEYVMQLPYHIITELQQNWIYDFLVLNKEMPNKAIQL